MSIRQRDYILRMIEQLAEAIARIAGARGAGKHEEALSLVRETADGILGPLRAMVEQLDSASAAVLLGSAEKVGAYAALTAEEAATHEAAGDARRAGAGYRRALELHLEAARLGEGAEARARALEAAGRLRGKVDERRLGQRYREALAALGA